jgi:hypothetical protein
MTDPTDPTPIDPRVLHWADRAARAGWGDALLTLLDVIAPLGPIGAGVLDVAQPAARLFGDHDRAISTLARLIETPDGAARLRGWLEARTAASDDDDAPPAMK